MEVNKTMMLITELPGQSFILFRMIPTTPDCPFLEALFDGKSFGLHIKSKATETSLIELPKLDTNGKPVFYKGEGNKPQQGKERRSNTEQYTYVITKPDEVDAFIERHAENAAEFKHQEIINQFREVINQMRSEHVKSEEGDVAADSEAPVTEELVETEAA